jgi:hypothetical protein
MPINKTEIKIFLTFFLISLIFTYWTSWNEETNFVLTKAIVDDKSFYLDSYQNETGDRNYLNGHYFAYFSHWGFSTLNTSLYFLFKFLTKNEIFIKFLLSVLTSVSFFSLSILLFYKLSQKFLRKEIHRILIVASYGFSTLAFQQARFFTTHSTESFFALLTFYLFFRFFENKKNRDLVLCGISIGFGLLLTDILKIFFSLLFFILFVRGKRKESIVFLLVVLSVYLPPYLGYLLFVKTSMSIFPSINLTGLPFFPEKFKNFVFPLSNFLQLLIFPSKGILFFYPILIFSLIGFLFIKKYRIESFSSFFFIIFTLLAISFVHPMWWFGWVSYGPSRVLNALMPFFAIGLMEFVKRFGFKILIPFVLISIFNNFLLLQYGEDKISTLSWEEYKYKMEHFQVLSNPLFEHYLPLTLINGPRSILLENLIIDKKISIDFKHPYNPETPEFVPPGSPIMKKFEVYLFSLPKIGIVVLRLPWLSLFIVAVLLILIWKNEIFSKIKINNWVLFLFLILIFFVSFIRVRDFTYGDNWCAPQWNENEKGLEEGRWIGQNATLFLFSKEKVNKTLRLVVESFERNQTLEIYLNGKFIGNYTIQEMKEILQPIKLKEGSNEILLKSRGDFINPWKIGVSCDTNVSFKISKISIV